MQLATWRKWGPRCGYPREQIKKNLSAQSGVGVSLGTASRQLFPPQPLVCFHNPWLGTVISTPPRVGYETRCGKALPYPRDSLPQDTVVRAAGPINPISCSISTLWHGGNYYYISFEKKTVSLSGPLSKAGDSGDTE